jgi:hypothetical protein
MLNEAERNYDIYNLELLAIVKALHNWRPLLAGSPHNIRVFSNHMNLQYWRDPQKISRRVAREFLELQEFPIKIHHVKGKSDGHADVLSRRPDYNQGEQDNGQGYGFAEGQWIGCAVTKTRLQPRGTRQCERHSSSQPFVRLSRLPPSIHHLPRLPPSTRCLPQLPPSAHRLWAPLTAPLHTPSPSTAPLCTPSPSTAPLHTPSNSTGAFINPSALFAQLLPILHVRCICEDSSRNKEDHPSSTSILSW